MVEDEIATLTRQWSGVDPDPIGTLLAAILGPQAEALDEYDRIQLAGVVRACRARPTLSEAERRLFARSREARTSRNDADRLRKYLDRFGLGWEGVKV